MPRAALVTAFAVDHLGAPALANEFKRLLAGVPPEQIAEDRASLRIPEHYDLEAPPGRPTPIADLLDQLQHHSPALSVIST